VSGGSPAIRRRRVALGALAVAAALGGAIIGSRVDSDPPQRASELAGNSAGEGPPGRGAGAPEEENEPTPAPGAPEEESEPGAAPPCSNRIAHRPARLAGQMLMVRMEAAATDVLLDRARRGELGGVILFPPEGADAAALATEVAKLDRAARGAGFPKPLVAIDQEGGEVKRLADSPPDLAPPEIEGAGGAPVAFDEGLATGRALEGIGVEIDLAPVLDVPVAGSFIVSRAFSDDPRAVGELGVAFAEGLGRAGVAATAKHFPGLGLASLNTDFESSAVDASRAALEPGLAPFREAVAAGIPLVMAANAVYPAYDPAAPASLSRRVIQRLLRRELGFDGVVITDDLGAAAITGAGYDEGTAALAAVTAGADLPLFALTDGASAAAALERAAKRDPAIRRRMVESCARITELRARLAVQTPMVSP